MVLVRERVPELELELVRVRELVLVRVWELVPHNRQQ